MEFFEVILNHSGALAVSAFGAAVMMKALPLLRDLIATLNKFTLELIEIQREIRTQVGVVDTKIDSILITEAASAKATKDYLEAIEKKSERILQTTEKILEKARMVCKKLDSDKGAM